MKLISSSDFWLKSILRFKRTQNLNAVNLRIPLCINFHPEVEIIVSDLNMREMMAGIWGCTAHPEYYGLAQIYVFGNVNRRYVHGLYHPLPAAY